ARGVVLLLAHARHAGARRGPRDAGERGGVRRVLRYAPAREPARRLGLRPERAAGLERGARRAVRGGHGALRERRGAAPRRLGRIPGRPRAHRVLDLARAPPPRPRRLQTRGRGLARRASLPVEHYLGRGGTRPSFWNRLAAPPATPLARRRRFAAPSCSTCPAIGRITRALDRAWNQPPSGSPRCSRR